MSLCALLIPTVRLFEPLHSIDDVHVTVDADGFTIVNVVLTALPMFVDPLFVCTVTVTVALALLPIALIHVTGIE